MARPPRPVIPRTGRRTVGIQGGARFVTTVHERDRGPLDGMLDLTHAATRDAPLDDVLDQLAERIAALVQVDVCSIYVREAGDELVLRATHGFPREAVGTVRMRVGEGLTGFAVECLRPVSVAVATGDARNKSFAALDEARFPSLCALPLVDAGRAVGALVVQRKEPRAFGRREVVLVAAMAPAVLLAFERAQARRRHALEAASDRGPRRPVDLALRGVAIAPGRALGTVAVQRAALAQPDARAVEKEVERRRLERAFDEAALHVAGLGRWAEERLAIAEDHRRAAAQRLAAARFVLDDQRLRERALRHVDNGATAEAAIERVTREYARVLGQAPEEMLRERALEIESLARVMLDRSAGDDVPPAPGRILAARRLSVFDAVELASTHGVGVALAGPADGSTGIEVARALGLPVVAETRSLFRWISDGDRAIVDGTEGLLLLNPSRTEVADLRRDRR